MALLCRWNLTTSILMVSLLLSFLLVVDCDHQNLDGCDRRVGDKKKIQVNCPDCRVELLKLDNQHIAMSNGIVSVILATPSGDITNVTYKGISHNLLDTQNDQVDRGYWTVVWNYKRRERNGTFQRLVGTSYEIIIQNGDQAEISFRNTWAAEKDGVPLNIDKRFVMLHNSSGFYSYTVLERLKGWPAFGIGIVRFAFKLQRNRFHYMAMSQERQRIMPMPEDRTSGQVLDYKEAVLLTHPSNPQFKGEVDDKYLYTCDNKDSEVHGWVSSDPEPVGFWMITPSNEFRSGGPLKQDLTSHVGPTTLAVFHSSHYAGKDLSLFFDSEEYWKKVFGPVYVYLNSHESAMANPSVLWDDAKKRAVKEIASWPYSFPLSKDFLKSNQRGVVHGQLLVSEPLIDMEVVAAASAYVGLASPGDAGSWQTESKRYQFWTKTDSNGTFLIQDVVPGTYNLYGWVPGRIGDYKYPSEITITPGSMINVRNVVFKPPREGPTLWEIGIPDRTAAEFFIPDAPPQYKIHQYNASVEKFRQYGLWMRYKELYPTDDLVFTVGSSDYKKDWFFAHVTRKVEDKQYAATTWKIVFNIEKVYGLGNYTLQLALASANGAELQVRLNDPETPPLLTTGLIGRDNALARHGIHGLYHLFSVVVPSRELIVGNNTILLTQSNALGPFREVMYDYIRLEGPNKF